jgi:hypothetical protein
MLLDSEEFFFSFVFLGVKIKPTNKEKGWWRVAERWEMYNRIGSDRG